MAELSNQLFGRIKNRLLRRGLELIGMPPAVIAGDHLVVTARSQCQPIVLRSPAGGRVCVWIDSRSTTTSLPFALPDVEESRIRERRRSPAVLTAGDQRLRRATGHEHQGAGDGERDQQRRRSAARWVQHARAAALATGLGAAGRFRRTDPAGAAGRWRRRRPPLLPPTDIPASGWGATIMHVDEQADPLAPFCRPRSQASPVSLTPSPH